MCQGPTVALSTAVLRGSKLGANFTAKSRCPSFLLANGRYQQEYSHEADVSCHATQTFAPINMLKNIKQTNKQTIRCLEKLLIMADVFSKQSCGITRLVF